MCYVVVTSQSLTLDQYWIRWTAGVPKARLSWTRRPESCCSIVSVGTCDASVMHTHMFDKMPGATQSPGYYHRHASGAPPSALPSGCLRVVP